MIADSLPNLNHYAAIHPLFHQVIEFIHSHNLSELETGTITIANGIRAIVDEYETKSPEERFIECHRRHIDVQVVVSGVEEIGCCNHQRCEVSAAYDEEKDYEELRGEMDLITLRQDDFAVFFTHDAHMPGLSPKGLRNRVRKIVFKIPA